MNLPPPLSINCYTNHAKKIEEATILEVSEIMKQARQYVRKINGALSNDDIVDITVSCDGTWQRRGFSSLFGAVFIIDYNTGLVLDYVVKSKFCEACRFWDSKDHDSEAYIKWKNEHEESCRKNFDGSAGSMEPKGALELFSRSMSYNICYTRLVCDGDSKTHSLLLEHKPYGPSKLVEKVDCVGHVQKRMGSALCDEYKGKKLSDSKTVGGKGRTYQSSYE